MFSAYIILNATSYPGIVANSDQARQRAEKRLKKEERAQDGRQAMIEYEAHALAVREKTARLKALRLAKGRL